MISFNISILFLSITSCTSELLYNTVCVALKYFLTILYLHINVMHTFLNHILLVVLVSSIFGQGDNSKRKIWKITHLLISIISKQIYVSYILVHLFSFTVTYLATEDVSVQTRTHSNNGTENYEHYMFTSSTDSNYSNISNNKSTNTGTRTNFKISTRSILSTTNESKPSLSAELLGEFDFDLWHTPEWIIISVKESLKLLLLIRIRQFLF